jgi:hypothetical protein
VRNGLLNTLPVHAAGYHESGSTNNALDRIISSYSPIVKALSYASERSMRAANLQSQKVLLARMAEQPELRFVETEIKSPSDLLSDVVQTSVIQIPTRDLVLLISVQAPYSCHSNTGLST